MKECPNCKKTYPDTDAFCTDCGTALSSAAPPDADEEPTTKIPAIPAKKPSEPAPPPPPPARAPAQKPQAPIAAVIALAACLALVLAAGVFAGYEALWYKNEYAQEQIRRKTAEEDRTTLLGEFDKLQLYHDDTASALEDANRQLDDVRSQLADASLQLSDGSSRLDAVEGELHGLLDMLRTGYGFSSRDYFASRGVVVLSRNSSATVTVFENMPAATVFTYRASDAGLSGQWNGSFADGQATVTITGVSPGYHTMAFTNDYNSESFDILVIVTD